MKLVAAIFINILVGYYFLAKTNSEYSILKLIERIAFFFAFGYGVPTSISIILAVIILLSPGYGVFLLWKVFEKMKNE